MTETSLSSKHQRTPQIGERRRALFSTSLEKSAGNTSDLGPIIPISFDNDSPCRSPSHTIGDYDILDRMPNIYETPTTRQSMCSETMSPLYLSPHISILAEKSKSHNLQTPHDSGTTFKLTKPNKPDDARKLAVKLDAKQSKVRASLFPDEQFHAVSTATFYPKNVAAVRNRMDDIPNKENRPKVAAVKRKAATRTNVSTINAAVRHKIRKPKQRKVSSEKPIRKRRFSVQVEEEQDAASPVSEEEPDLKRKFFKYSRSAATCTIDKNIKLNLDKGKLSLMGARNVRKYQSQSSASDDDSQNGKVVELRASALVSESDQSILLHNVPPQLKEAPCTRANVIKSQEVDDALLSPTSQMCDMTSGLALSSPKRSARNLNAVLEKMPNNIVPKEATRKRMFPVFDANNATKQNVETKAVRVAKRFKGTTDESQMQLDAGQKKFGAVRCPECSLIYEVGNPADESMHMKHHNSNNVFRFPGWKAERLNYEKPNCRIIQIIPGDSRSWWNRAKTVLEVVNKDLGFYETKGAEENYHVFLYIHNKVIVGCLTAAPQREGHRLLTQKPGGGVLAEQKAVPIKCGVSRIWVSRTHRRSKIATEMMDTMKWHFQFGVILTDDEIAFSSPTDMGRSFAEKYFGTPNYLVYF